MKEKEPVYCAQIITMPFQDFFSSCIKNALYRLNLKKPSAFLVLQWEIQANHMKTTLKIFVFAHKIRMYAMIHLSYAESKPSFDMMAIMLNASGKATLNCFNKKKGNIQYVTHHLSHCLSLRWERIVPVHIGCGLR